MLKLSFKLLVLIEIKLIFVRKLKFYGNDWIPEVTPNEDMSLSHFDLYVYIWILLW